MNKHEALEKLKEIANGTGWISYTNACNIISEINMHQLGYDVEKEQLYTVEIPNPNDETTVYLYRTTKGSIAINTIYNNPNWKEFPQAKLTENEIKQDFSWAWKWVETVSEEVER